MIAPAPVLERLRHRLNALLDRALSDIAMPLHKAMRYASLQGGKRFRPLLVYTMGLSLQAKEEDLDYPAMAVEIIHAYSLIHDDLPAMDNDLLRRGQPTCHVVFGEAMAILAGDAMQAFAFEILSEGSHPNTLKMIRYLAKACGPEGMAGGQAGDLLAIGKSLSVAELEQIHRAKTGELIRASVLLGALAAPGMDAAALDDFSELGLLLGLAYQIQDDIFDVELSTDVRGKQQGADAQLNKPTYPAMLGLAGAKEKLLEVVAKLNAKMAMLNLTHTLFANLVAEVVERKI